MRSYSSLLSHILGSHPEISGYSELHQSYRSHQDLIKMKSKISIAYDKKLSTSYLLDKILHNQYSMDFNLLQSNNVKTLFFFFLPAQTLKSIIKMSFNINNMKNYQNEQYALYYYEKRLLMLTQYVRLIKQGSLFIQSEHLLDNTSSTLNFIENYLSLNTPIREEYNIYKYSGQPLHGDSSKRLFEKRITQEKEEKQELHISNDILKKAEKSYLECKVILEDHCFTM